MRRCVICITGVLFTMVQMQSLDNGIQVAASCAAKTCNFLHLSCINKPLKTTTARAVVLSLCSGWNATASHIIKHTHHTRNLSKNSERRMTITTQAVSHETETIEFPSRSLLDRTSIIHNTICRQLIRVSRPCCAAQQYMYCRCLCNNYKKFQVAIHVFIGC